MIQICAHSSLIFCLSVLLLVLPAARSGVAAKNNALKTNTSPLLQAKFNIWLKKKVAPRAITIGISPDKWAQIMPTIKLYTFLPDLDLPASVQKKPKKQQQSEFASPGRYFTNKSLNWLVRAGRARAKKWRKVLNKIEHKYSVPRHIILAIWGRESNYGTVKIPHSGLSILATQAFMGRRRDLFFKELIAALEMIHHKGISDKQLKSSWAGAMGYPQFMPTTYLKYAVDFDGDGIANIWSSVPDTLASIANFLHQNGWNPRRHWGQEIILPRTVSCTLEGPDRNITGKAWMKSGIRKAVPPKLRRHHRRKRRLRLNKQLKYWLVNPAGRLGPAFLLSENFYVLKRYNESDVYALFVAHLADRYKRNVSFAGRWKKVDSLPRHTIAKMQERMIKMGHDVGGADGLVGFKTRRAIGLYQQKNALRETCYPNRQLVHELLKK